MALKLSTGARTALANDEGLKTIFSGGYIDIYSGGQPSSPDYAETGTKLLRIGIGGTGGVQFGTAASGEVPKSAETWSGTVDAAGVGGWFRLYGTGGTSGSSTSEKRIDGNVGVSGSDLVLANTTFAANATVTIDTFTLQVPQS